MASATQITFTISLVMLILFSFAIIGFAVSFADDNDAAMSIADDSELSSLRTEIDAGLDQFETEARDTYTSILDTTIEPGSDVMPSAAPFAITPGNVVQVSMSIILLPYKKIFGSGSGFKGFFITFIVFIIFIFGLLLYKALRGNP